MRTPNEALRELRNRLVYFCGSMNGKYDPPWAQELVGIIDEALAVPLRNCDVGNPEEQATRCRAFCDKHKIFKRGFGYCYACPLRDEKNCSISWSQLPYKDITK